MSKVGSVVACGLALEMINASVDFSQALTHWMDDVMREAWAHGHTGDKAWHCLEQLVD